MAANTSRWWARLRARAEQLVTVAAVALAATWSVAQTRLDGPRHRDHGSESVQTAVLVAIGLALAVALGAAITAVVHKYQAQIH